MAKYGKKYEQSYAGRAMDRTVFQSRWNKAYSTLKYNVMLGEREQAIKKYDAHEAEVNKANERSKVQESKYNLKLGKQAFNQGKAELHNLYHEQKLQDKQDRKTAKKNDQRERFTTKYAAGIHKKEEDSIVNPEVVRRLDAFSGKKKSTGSWYGADAINRADEQWNFNRGVKGAEKDHKNYVKNREKLKSKQAKQDNIDAKVNYKYMKQYANEYDKNTKLGDRESNKYNAQFLKGLPNEKKGAPEQREETVNGEPMIKSSEDDPWSGVFSEMFKEPLLDESKYTDKDAGGYHMFNDTAYDNLHKKSKDPDWTWGNNEEPQREETINGEPTGWDRITEATSLENGQKKKTIFKGNSVEVQGANTDAVVTGHDISSVGLYGQTLEKNAWSRMVGDKKSVTTTPAMQAGIDNEDSLINDFNISTGLNAKTPEQMVMGNSEYAKENFTRTAMGEGVRVANTSAKSKTYGGVFDALDVDSGHIVEAKMQTTASASKSHPDYSMQAAHYANAANDVNPGSVSKYSVVTKGALSDRDINRKAKTSSYNKDTGVWNSGVFASSYGQFGNVQVDIHNAGDWTSQVAKSRAETMKGAINSGGTPMNKKDQRDVAKEIV